MSKKINNMEHQGQVRAVGKSDEKIDYRVAFCQLTVQKYRSDFLRRFYFLTKADLKLFYADVKRFHSKKFLNYDKIFGFPRKALWSLNKMMYVGGNNYIVSVSPGLFLHLLRFRPEVIVTDGEVMMLNNFSIFLYAKLFRIPVVWWSLGKVVTRRRTNVNALFDWLIRWQVMNSHMIVGKNTMALEHFANRYGIPPERMLVAPNTMDDIAIREEMEEAREAAKELRARYGGGPVVLFVGAILRKVKKLDDLLKAMRIVWESCPEARLIIVGGGDDLEELQKDVKKMGVDDRVIFTGAVHEAISQYFLIADVMVLPGLGGLAIPHAMIHGVPVIAGVADGTEKDLIEDGVNGYLLGSPDSHVMAEKILPIITNPELRASMSEKCLDKIDSHWNIWLQCERMSQAVRNTKNSMRNIGRFMTKSSDYK